MREHVAKRPGDFIPKSSFPGGPRGLRGLGGEQEQLHLDEGKQEGSMLRLLRGSGWG